MNRLQNTKEKPTITNKQDIERLLSTMTVEEKAGQMTQISLDLLLHGDMYNVRIPHEIDPQKLNTALVQHQVGSVLNVAGIPYTREEWLKVLSVIQSTITRESRLGIPVIYGIDAVHGTNYTIGATLFPQQIGMAASWNPNLVEEAARITAFETRASGIPWNFSPVLDVSRQPLWPRMWESFGEDTYLTSQLGTAMVKGYEGKDVGNSERVSACLKHYLGYGMPLNGKDRTPAWIPERYMREYYLPPFAAAIEAGAHSIMVNSGEINGIPTHASHYLLTKILREELGFKGLVVTDWEDIKYLHTRHRIASTQKEAVRLAIEAGIDMSMVPDDFSFTSYLIELVKEGSIPETRLDESVRRILLLKLELGLFENPIPATAREYTNFNAKAHQATALQLARESITLAKNEKQQLPLHEKATVLVTGCTANAMRFLNGGWSYTWQGDQTDQYAKDQLTFLDAMEQKTGKERLKYVPGCTYDQSFRMEEAVQVAQTVDHIILCLGEEPYTEFHGNIDDLNLPTAQIELAQAMIQTGKPVTLILLQGRPRIISAFADEIDSIILGYLPGNEGGKALAEVLYGDYNPSGKLPFTYPRFANALVTYDYKFSEINPIQGSRICYDPQFEFGSGLSYTTFAYRDLQLSKHQITETENLEVEITIHNTGSREGAEIVQLYLRDDYASITPSFRRLRRFQKIKLDSGESQKLSFVITKRDLEFVGQSNQWVCEKGTFTIMIGNLEDKFELI